MADPRMPRDRVPINVGPRDASARAPSPPRGREATTRLDAAALASDKGREIAEQLAKVKMDGRKEAAVLPKAVMLCAAGHLIGDTTLIDKGRSLAREVEAVARRIAPGQPILAAAAATKPFPIRYSRSPRLARRYDVMTKEIPGYTRGRKERIST